MLYWQYHARGVYWANADGSSERRYGQDGYSVMLILGQWRAVYDGGPSSSILGRGTFAEVQALCEAHAQALIKRDEEWRY